MSLSKSLRAIAIHAPCFALRFLVHPNERLNARTSMPGFSDSAIFRRPTRNALMGTALMTFSIGAINAVQLNYTGTVSIVANEFSDRLHSSWLCNLASAASTGWTEAGFPATSSTVKMSYSCRIGLAGNLAVTIAIANHHLCHVRFPPRRFCNPRRTCHHP